MVLNGKTNPHNPEVVGSSPASATMSSSRNGFRYDYFFVLVRYALPYQLLRAEVSGEAIVRKPRINI